MYRITFSHTSVISPDTRGLGSIPRSVIPRSVSLRIALETRGSRPSRLLVQDIGGNTRAAAVDVSFSAPYHVPDNAITTERTKMSG